MRVRGWYMPATRSTSRKEAGKPGLVLLVAESSAAFSLTLGPSKASKPRPRPLGFLLTIGMFLLKFGTLNGCGARCGFQCLQTRQSFGPVAQA